MADQNIFLVEIDYRYESASPAGPLVGMLRLANIEYFDDVNGYVYAEAINSIPTFSRSLSGDQLGVYQSSLGSVEIDNADGEFDYLLGLAMDGSEVRIYQGSKTLLRSQFTYLFSALAQKAAAPSLDRISIQLRDTLLLLNKSIGGEDPVGGTGPNADRQRPVNFGYVHQLELLIYDSSILQYVHSDTGNGAIAAHTRDRGVDISYVDQGDGTLVLDASPDGAVTADILALPLAGSPAGMTWNVSDAFDFFVGSRGGLFNASLYFGPHDTFTVGDADDYSLGISLPEARNIIDLLSDIVDSGNCFWAVRRTGLFTYGRLTPNDIAGFGLTPVEIETDDIDDGTLKVDHVLPKYYKYQGYMSKNWSPQEDLASSLTPDERAVFSRKGLYLIQADSVGTTYADSPQLYDLTLEVAPPQDTLISAGDTTDSSQLTLWMERRRAMTLPWLETVSFTVGLEFYELELGDVVNLTVERFGWDAGVLFQVIAININATKQKIELQLLRRHALGEEEDNTGSPGGGGGPAEFFLDNFTGTGNLSTRNPDVGSAYINDGGGSLSDLVLNGSGGVPSSLSSVTPLSAATYPGATYTLRCDFNITATGTDFSAAQLLGVFDPAGADVYLLEFDFHWTGTVGSPNNSWFADCFVDDSGASTLFGDSDIDVTSALTLGVHYVEIVVTPSGTDFKIDGATISSTASVPDILPTYVGFENTKGGATTNVTFLSVSGI